MSPADLLASSADERHQRLKTGPSGFMIFSHFLKHAPFLPASAVPINLVTPRRRFMSARLAPAGGPRRTSNHKEIPMRCSLFVGLSFVGLLLFAPAWAEEKEKKFDKEKLVGKWEFVSGEKEGKKSEADALKGTVEITKDTLTIMGGEDGKQIFPMKYKLDLDKKPVTIVLDGTDGLVKDQTVKGIVEFDGDNLKICYALPGEEFPKEFKTKEGSKTHSFVMKKVK
jgi:uncharacterized protein (TIGR03067 family)